MAATNKRTQWLLTGAETLVGKEIQELAEQRKLPVTIITASAERTDSVITEREGELAVVAPLDEFAIGDSAVAILAGSTETHETARALAEKAKSDVAFVDATGALEHLPEARICAPLAELMPGLEQIHVAAHPAAVALARVLKVLKPTRTVATIHEPASERGREGVDELHQQTVKLFNFQSLPKEIFDTQVAFSLVARYGEEANTKLVNVETRIEKHLATLLAPAALAVPSIKLIQAPVFHGYMISVWVEFATRADAGDIATSLKAAGFDVRDAETEPVGNASVAGESGITISEISVDRSHAKGAWLWMSFDNVRAHADNLLLMAALLSRESGIQ